MDDIIVSSWQELQERLFDDSWRPDLQRFRSPYAFRGLGDSAYRLETSLMRLGGDVVELERHLLRNFRKYAHRDLVERDSIWHWLAVTQHHGLPTRLLDWTFSPYVALHFATVNIELFGADSAVWAVNILKVHELLPSKLRCELEREGSAVFTVEMLDKAIPSLSDFDALSVSDLVVIFEPPSLDDRIVNQFALFSVISNPRAALDEWLMARPELCRRLIIPAGMKWEVRDKLDQANITERVLFPGLDGLSSWLRRYYSPRR